MDYTFEIEDEFLEQMLENTKDDVKTKSFWDLMNLQGQLNREVYLTDIEDGTGTSVEGQIRFWNEFDDAHNIPIEERKPIKLFVDSYGGSLVETFCMIDAIKMSKTPVWGICRSAAYSGGFFTMIACHKRIGYKHSSYLYHEGATGTSGTANQFENYSAFYKRQLKQLEDHTLNKTNITKEMYDEKRRDDWWMDAEEAMEYGVIDEIAEDFV